MYIQSVVRDGKRVLCSTYGSDIRRYCAGIEHLQLATPDHLAERFDDMMTARTSKNACLMVDIECLLFMLFG